MKYSEDKAQGKHYNGFVIPPNDVGEMIDGSYLEDNLNLSKFSLRVIDKLTYGVVYGGSIITNDFVGLTLSPYFFALYLHDLDAIEFTIMKKAMRMGRGASTVEQDIADIIGACHQGLIFTSHVTMYNNIQSLCEEELEHMNNG